MHHVYGRVVDVVGVVDVVYAVDAVDVVDVVDAVDGGPPYSIYLINLQGLYCHQRKGMLNFIGFKVKH